MLAASLLHASSPKTKKARQKLGLGAIAQTMWISAQPFGLLEKSIININIRKGPKTKDTTQKFALIFRSSRKSWKPADFTIRFDTDYPLLLLSLPAAMQQLIGRTKSTVIIFPYCICANIIFWAIFLSQHYSKKHGHAVIAP
jgi:hypothetical protein